MLSDRALRRLLRIPFLRNALLRAMTRFGPHLRELRAEGTQTPLESSGEAPAPGLIESIDIPEITPLIARESEDGADTIRLNLLVPGLSERHVFGGIATALQFFDRLREGTESLRILVLDELRIARRKDAFYSDWPVYSLAEIADRDPSGPHIVVCGDRYGHTLPVTSGDRFVATIWWSAHLAHRLLDWQEQRLGLKAPRLAYLIQDYEPGFYSWSSRYALADATYRRPERTLAVINTQFLADFLQAQRVRFLAQWVFAPHLNPALAAMRLAALTSRKERVLLVYGRPGTERNAFPLLIAALRHWASMDPTAASWQVLSAGEPHASVTLGNGIEVRALGKLPIEDYAALLARAAVGVSLMISPHPSYPPLEMAAFGCRVVTNRFANKDLSALCPAVTSVESLDAPSLAAAIAAACREASDHDLLPLAPAGLDSFLDGGDPFAFVAEVRRAWLQH